jgi:hypothetical protein
MPCSLERMLSNHNQSMFEYLAPTRSGHYWTIIQLLSRRNGARGGMQPPQQQPRQSHNEGYMDQVF